MNKAIKSTLSLGAVGLALGGCGPKTEYEEAVKYSAWKRAFEVGNNEQDIKTIERIITKGKLHDVIHLDAHSHLRKIVRSNEDLIKLAEKRVDKELEKGKLIYNHSDDMRLDIAQMLASMSGSTTALNKVGKEHLEQVLERYLDSEENMKKNSTHFMAIHGLNVASGCFSKTKNKKMLDKLTILALYDMENLDLAYNFSAAAQNRIFAAETGKKAFDQGSFKLAYKCFTLTGDTYFKKKSIEGELEKIGEFSKWRKNNKQKLEKLSKGPEKNSKEYQDLFDECYQKEIQIAESFKWINIAFYDFADKELMRKASEEALRVNKESEANVLKYAYHIGVSPYFDKNFINKIGFRAVETGNSGLAFTCTDQTEDQKLIEKTANMYKTLEGFRLNNALKAALKIKNKARRVGMIENIGEKALLPPKDSSNRFHGLDVAYDCFSKLDNKTKIEQVGDAAFEIGYIDLADKCYSKVGRK